MRKDIGLELTKFRKKDILSKIPYFDTRFQIGVVESSANPSECFAWVYDHVQRTGTAEISGP